MLYAVPSETELLHAEAISVKTVEPLQKRLEDIERGNANTLFGYGQEIF
ncbi:MAG: hypothetical protein HY460_00255 [Parcubacteria group bacterium]|nr:hypothetical protein [Parcubacteria group bacterium]